MAKTFTGVVTSDRGDKTIVVSVSTRKTHPIYKKQYSVSKKFMAHDEQNDAKVGDTVTVAETRPISARKHFMLVKVNERAAIRHEEPETVDKLPVVSDQVLVKGKVQKTDNGKQKTTKLEAKS